MVCIVFVHIFMHEYKRVACVKRLIEYYDYLCLAPAICIYDFGSFYCEYVHVVTNKDLLIKK